MLFFDRNPDTGEVIPTTYDSMHAYLTSVNHVSERVPHDIRERIATAIDFTALAYDQANLGRQRLFVPLTRSATALAVLAFELSLKRRLGDQVKKTATLGQLIKEAKKQNLLPESELHHAFIHEVYLNRNRIIHGDQDVDDYGIATPEAIGAVVDICNSLVG